MTDVFTAAALASEPAAEASAPEPVAAPPLPDLPPTQSNLAPDPTVPPSASPSPSVDPAPVVAVATSDPDVPDLKPGWATTEFWTTLLTHAITVVSVLLVSLHVTVFNSATLTPMVPAAALLASMIAQAVYTSSRGKVKAAHVTAISAAVQARTEATVHMQELALRYGTAA